MTRPNDSPPDGTDERSTSHRPREEAAAIADPDSPSRQHPPPEETTSQASIAGDQQWLPLFPFDEPYQQQVTGINDFVATLAENGYYAVEGACGTGKTLIGLVGALHAIHAESVTSDGTTRQLPDFERVVAVTPVKQQLKQFIAEVRAINRNLSATGEYDHADTIVLRGLTDMLAYTNADDFEFRRRASRALARADADGLDTETPSRGDQIDRLRTTTREIIKAGSQIGLDWEITEPDTCTVGGCRHLAGNPQMEVCPFHADAGPDQDPPWCDIVRAERVVELVEDLPGDRLQVNGAKTPYPDRLPIVGDLVEYESQTGGIHAKAPFDPFYAKAAAGLASVGFDDGEHRILDREALVTASAASGSCPHVRMGSLASSADVVVGNYNHLFDPQTRQLTAGKAALFDEESILVVDEAHRVEGRVRDLLSDDLSPYALLRVRQDIGAALQLLNGDIQRGTTDQQHTAEQTAERILGEVSDRRTLTRESLERGIEFTEWLVDAIDDLVVEHLDSEYRYWESALGDGNPQRDSVTLGDPEHPSEPDALTQKLTASDGFNPDYLTQFPTICDAAARIHSDVELSDRETICQEAGEMLGRWHTADSVTHHRELVIEHSPHSNPPSRLPDWIEHVTARLHLFNTIPSERVAAIYDETGGGIVMSATLAPIDDYKRTAGLDPLGTTSAGEIAGTPPAGAMVTASDIGDRPVETNTYELAFPEEHRASWIVDVPKYTSRNRGTPTQNWKQMKPARKQCAQALADIASSYGNHLIAMPNYAEAKWAGTRLESEVDKPVYIDRSSSSEQTTDMLDSFFADDHAVFITSSLGTVTEGVDYDGEKLHCATVVGVPFRDITTGRAQAIIEAYDREVADDSQSGFETAVGIPAVRKARQAIGRVLRAPSEHGVRIFLDERYGKTGKYNVGQYLSPVEFEEFQFVGPDMLSFGFERFWEDVPRSETAEGASTDTGTTGSADTADADTTGSTAETGGKSSGSATDYSKIYFGQGASLSGWVKVETSVAETEIVPIVERRSVESEDETEANVINLNFSTDLPPSGWTLVEADAVRTQIEPIARRAERDDS